MFRITEMYGDRIVGENNVTGEVALSRFVEELAHYSVMEAHSNGPAWYVLEMNQYEQRIVIGDKLPGGSPDELGRTSYSLKFEVTGNNAEGFDALYMTAFFYAAATGAYTPAIGEQMTRSSRITGIHPASATTTLKPGIVHWHPNPA